MVGRPIFLFLVHIGRVLLSNAGISELEPCKLSADRANVLLVTREFFLLSCSCSCILVHLILINVDICFCSSLFWICFSCPSSFYLCFFLYLRTNIIFFKKNIVPRLILTLNVLNYISEIIQFDNHINKL